MCLFTHASKVRSQTSAPLVHSPLQRHTAVECGLSPATFAALRKPNDAAAQRTAFQALVDNVRQGNRNSLDLLIDLARVDNRTGGEAEYQLVTLLILPPPHGPVLADSVLQRLTEKRAFTLPHDQPDKLHPASGVSRLLYLAGIRESPATQEILSEPFCRQLGIPPEKNLWSPTRPITAHELDAFRPQGDIFGFATTLQDHHAQPTPNIQLTPLEVNGTWVLASERQLPDQSNEVVVFSAGALGADNRQALRNKWGDVHFVESRLQKEAQNGSGVLIYKIRELVTRHFVDLKQKPADILAWAADGLGRASPQLLDDFQQGDRLRLLYTLIRGRAGMPRSLRVNLGPDTALNGRQVQPKPDWTLTRVQKNGTWVLVCERQRLDQSNETVVFSAEVLSEDNRQAFRNQWAGVRFVESPLQTVAQNGGRTLIRQTHKLVEEELAEGKDLMDCLEWKAHVWGETSPQDLDDIQRENTHRRPEPSAHHSSGPNGPKITAHRSLQHAGDEGAIDDSVCHGQMLDAPIAAARPVGPGRLSITAQQSLQHAGDEGAIDDVESGSPSDAAPAANATHPASLRRKTPASWPSGGTLSAFNLSFGPISDRGTKPTASEFRPGRGFVATPKSSGAGRNNELPDPAHRSAAPGPSPLSPTPSP